jgi:HEPN domain-containing protein/predicted nucleotidyltransferase
MKEIHATIVQGSAAVERRRLLLLSELTRIGKILSAERSIRQILVFGSVATGAVHEWSDLDVLVVQETDAPFLERSRRLIALTRPSVGAEFLVYTTRELADMANRPFVHHELLQKGKALPMDPKADAERWLTFATDDIRMARLAWREEIWSQVCFHAQQCVEKCLKGLLARAGQLLPRTHAVADLWDVQTPDTRMVLSDLEAGLRELDRFYIPTRYPDALPGILPEGLPRREEAEEALAIAEECFRRARTVVDPPGQLSPDRATT